MPAAGRASRLGEISCSKEILPLDLGDGHGPQPACRPLLKGWADAGISRALVLLRPGKWDIPATLGSGDTWGLHLGYLLAEDSLGVPDTLDRAYRWSRDTTIALGFPDILLRPGDVWSRLVEFHGSHPEVVSLGLFPTRQTWKTDMVALDAGDRVRDIVIKQKDCDLRWTWSIAIWDPPFTEFLHDWWRQNREEARSRELYIGDALRAGIEAGIQLLGLRFEGGAFLDIGTPEDLARAGRPDAFSDAENVPRSS